jgi:hypothetical protein
MAGPAHTHTGGWQRSNSAFLTHTHKLAAEAGKRWPSAGRADGIRVDGPLAETQRADAVLLAAAHPVCEMALTKTEWAGFAH